jgi:hypothetical protein
MVVAVATSPLTREAFSWKSISKILHSSARIEAKK